MLDDPIDSLALPVAIVLVMLISLSLIALFHLQAYNATRKLAVEKGFAKYDPQTSKWEWKKPKWKEEK